VAILKEVRATLDPVFAAIERHRKAWETTHVTVDNPMPRDKAAHKAALAELMDVAPTTLSGVRAVIAHFVEFDRGHIPEKGGEYLATLARSPAFAAETLAPMIETVPSPYRASDAVDRAQELIAAARMATRGITDKTEGAPLARLLFTIREQLEALLDELKQLHGDAWNRATFGILARDDRRPA
jgi:hypothetical protein